MQWGTSHDDPPKSQQKKHYARSRTKSSNNDDDDDDHMIGSAGPDLTSASELDFLAFKDGDGEVSDDGPKTTAAKKVSPAYHNHIVCC